jgi:DNA polymerase-1
MTGNDIVSRRARDPRARPRRPPVSRPRLFLIDGSSQLYRAYHAIRGLTGPDGRSTNAVYGFVTMLRKLLADQRPAYVAAAFDLAGPTFRTDLAADYKANRAPMPPDLAEQIPLVHEACEALGVPVVTSATYEADDVIGTLAVQAVAAQFDVVIVTGDKDFLQLVSDAVRVYNPRDEGTWYDVAAVKERFGVEPGQVVDVVALMGDAIDNIKGVPGIGEKGARDLIARFGSLEALLARLQEVPQKKYREALAAHADAARRSRQLATIRTDVPVVFDPEQLRYRGPDRARCFALFSKLGFRSLLMEYAPTVDTVATDYRVVRTRADLADLLTALGRAERIGLRVLADEAAPMRARVVGLAMADRPYRAWYVPLGHTGLDGTTEFAPEEALARLRDPLEAAALAKVGHDVKADLLLLRRHGIHLAGVVFDTLLAAYLIDATRAPHSLEELALDALGYRAITEEHVRGRRGSLGELPCEAVGKFAGERADLALRLAEPLRQTLEREGLLALYQELEHPLIPVLVEMELAGVRIDPELLAAQSARIEQELDALAQRIYELAGTTFNLHSPRQLGQVLFERLGLPPLKRTGKTRAASTAVDVLEELALVHELPRLVLEWRALQKLKGTYIDALPELIHPETGRIHTTFNQAVTATGRLSSSDPNLQNIPIRTELGRAIRRAFVADPGSVLVAADYSQIELRILAHLAGDEALVAAFCADADIHEETARHLFGEASPLDPHERRRLAKMVNYALLYGKTAFTLARDLGVPQETAQAFIDVYFARFPGVRRFLDDTLARARATGVVKTLFGRRRLVPELTSANAQIRAAAERYTVNLPIQGTAADILKRAMIDLAGALPPEARMILTVHDELVFEVPRGIAREVAEVVKTRMERAVSLAVPLRVEVGIGDSWAAAKA